MSVSNLLNIFFSEKKNTQFKREKQNDQESSLKRSQSVDLNVFVVVRTWFTLTSDSYMLISCTTTSMVCILHNPTSFSHVPIQWWLILYLIYVAQKPHPACIECYRLWCRFILSPFRLVQFYTFASGAWIFSLLILFSYSHHNKYLKRKKSFRKAKRKKNGKSNYENWKNDKFS